MAIQSHLGRLIIQNCFPDDRIIINFRLIVNFWAFLPLLGAVLKGIKSKISLFLAIILVTAITLVPAKASAWSITEFVSGLFGGAEKVSADEVPSYNSQTIPLPQAILNPEATPIDPNEDLMLVDGNVLAVESMPVEPEMPKDRISIYTVRKGDTISAIAKMYGVTSNTIIWGNDIKKGVISEGQTLVILPVSGVQHVVKSGDTVKSIVNLYKADIDEVLQYNGLSADAKLAVGDTILVPDGEIAPAPVTKTSTGTIKSPIAKAISSYPKISGYYIRPLVGGVRTQGIHGYNAVDIAASYGTPIVASAPGVVIVSKTTGWNSGYGKYVVISHSNGTQTLYAHLSENLVSVGDTVSQGQKVGLMGNSGKVQGATGVHLHFEIRGAKNPF